MTTPTHEARITAVAEVLGLGLTRAQSAALARYLALLQRWNAVYNLTAVRDPEEMLVQHVYDCLAAVQPLRRALAGGDRGRVLDVGSGGGLPGVVFAVACPDVQIVCVDTVGKKAAFLRQVGAELRLPQLSAVHGRVEQLQLPAFDLVTSRAFASLTDFVNLTRALLKPGGVWMAMKGKWPSEEIAALPASVAMFHVEPLAVPGLAAERCLVWMRPAST